jgi:hypothetical protein
LRQAASSLYNHVFPPGRFARSSADAALVKHWEVVQR